MDHDWLEAMWVRRAVAAGVSVIVAAVTGVVTALVTSHPSLGLWVALGLAVIVGAILQAVVTYGESVKSRRVQASGAATVADTADRRSKKSVLASTGKLSHQLSQINGMAWPLQGQDRWPWAVTRRDRSQRK
jgi:hypothetical protein